MRCDQIAIANPWGFTVPTHKGGIAHEAEGIATGDDSQPFVGPPVTGVSGTWPAETSEAQGQRSRSWNSTTTGSRRKGERVSESKRHGIVSCNPAGLLTRGRPRTCGCVGLPVKAVHGDHQTRRSSEPDPSLAIGISSELGQAFHPSVAQPRRRAAEVQKAVGCMV